MSVFRDDLARARGERLPHMALRRLEDGALDDVVVEEVRLFHAERMSDDALWMCCDIRGGGAIHFNVRAVQTGARRGRPGRLEFDVFEMPREWVDIDAERRSVRAREGER